MASPRSLLPSDVSPASNGATGATRRTHPHSWRGRRVRPSTGVSPASGGAVKREAQKPPFDPRDEYLALYLKTVQGAKRVVLKASFRWWEVRRRKRALDEQGPPKAPTP